MDYNRMTRYQSLLQDERWYKRRYEILLRDEFMCTKCGRGHELQIHHKRYVSGKMPWEYEDKDLTTLCASCHCRINDPPKGEYTGFVSASEFVPKAVQKLINS